MSWQYFKLWKKARKIRWRLPLLRWAICERWKFAALCTKTSQRLVREETTTTIAIFRFAMFHEDECYSQMGWKQDDDHPKKNIVRGRLLYTSKPDGLRFRKLKILSGSIAWNFENITPINSFRRWFSDELLGHGEGETMRPWGFHERREMRQTRNNICSAWLCSVCHGAPANLTMCEREKKAYRVRGNFKFKVGQLLCHGYSEYLQQSMISEGVLALPFVSTNSSGISYYCNLSWGHQSE